MFFGYKEDDVWIVVDSGSEDEGEPVWITLDQDMSSQAQTLGTQEVEGEMGRGKRKRRVLEEDGLKRDSGVRKSPPACFIIGTMGAIKAAGP